MMDAAARILSYLSEQEEPRYGLEISWGARVGPGRLYPALTRLERDGYIIGEWVGLRKYYHATHKGISAAKENKWVLESMKR